MSYLRVLVASAVICLAVQNAAAAQVTDQVDESSQEQVGDGEAAQGDVEQVMNLQDELNEVLAATNAAQGRVERTWELMRALEALEESGEVDEATGVDARQEALQVLVGSMDDLTVKALEIRDRVGGTTVPEMQAMEARLGVNLDRTEDPTERDQMQSLLGKAVQNRTLVEKNVARLANNIESIKAARRRLAKQLGYLELVKGVVETGQDVGDALRQLNEGMEQVIRQLEVNP